MKIKEVEERVGLTRSNIRFYEREGLLLVDRDQENNYRDYTEADVEKINKIKALRMLGAPTADIKRLFADEITFDEVISDCMKRIEEQEKELKEIHKVCENMMQKQLDIHSWDGQIEMDAKNVWKVRLNEIFSQDKVHDPIEQKKMNKNIMLMLLVGYTLNIQFTTLLWTVFEKFQNFAGNGIPGRYDNFKNGLDISDVYGYSIHVNYSYLIVCVCFVVMLICKGIIFYSENVKIQFLLFVVNSLILSPVILCLIKWYEGMLIMWNGLKVLKYQVFSLGDLWMFWMVMMIYVVVIYIASLKWNHIFDKYSYTLIISSIFTVLYAGIIFLIYDCFFGPLIFLGIMFAFVSFSWTRVNREQEKYSRYDSFTTANFIINPLGGFIQF